MGVTANAHLVAGFIGASPFLEFPYDPPEWDLRPARLHDGLSADGGCRGLAEFVLAPGMGYELNDELLERTKVS